MPALLCPHSCPHSCCARLPWGTGSWRFLSSGRDIPTGAPLAAAFRVQEDHAHEDVLLLGNTQEEAQAVSRKTCLRSWEMQEELEDEIKLSVGKQPSPLAVLCLQGSPQPLPICGKDTALQRAQILQRPWGSN